MQDLTFFYKLLSGLKLFLIPEFHPRPLLGINNSKISPFDIERFDEYTLKHFDGCYLRIHAELPILWLMSGLAFLNINIPNVRSIFLLFTSVIKRASRFFSFRFVSFRFVYRIEILVFDRIKQFTILYDGKISKNCFYTESKKYILYGCY